ncbi:hypothetical protein [Nocardia abscessus]|uniref:hypothetical protein n=1 Tax=Nocardia abscessus TaxID=120957 RepID=UPI00245494DF|nr:hypothetical protein [Nocardia abscessus]
MSKTGRFNPRRPEKGRNKPNQRQHRIIVHGVQRKQPDLQKLGRAVIAMALAEAEAEEAEATATQVPAISDNDEQEASHDD